MGMWMLVVWSYLPKWDDGMKQHNQTEPVFEATEDFLKTDLFRLKGHRDPKKDLLHADSGPNKTRHDPVKGSPFLEM